MNPHGIAAGGFFRALTLLQRRLRTTVWKVNGGTETNTRSQCSWVHVLNAAALSSGKAAASSATTVGLQSAGKGVICSIEVSPLFLSSQSHHSPLTRMSVESLRYY
jgi:hypothetical protein